MHNSIVKRGVLTSVSLAAALTALQFCAPLANASDKLIELS